jgi:hypothetical protein
MSANLARLNCLLALPFHRVKGQPAISSFLRNINSATLLAKVRYNRENRARIKIHLYLSLHSNFEKGQHGSPAAVCRFSCNSSATADLGARKVRIVTISERVGNDSSVAADLGTGEDVMVATMYKIFDVGIMEAFRTMTVTMAEAKTSILIVKDSFTKRATKLWVTLHTLPNSNSLQ